MLKHLYLLMASTFVIGVVTGVYVFFMTKEYEPDTIAKDARTGFEVIATMYGDCPPIGCASYRIDDSGSFTYMRSLGGERTEDELTPLEVATLRRELQRETLEELIAEPRTHGLCSASNEERSYRYEVRIGETWYKVDSCVIDTSRVAVFATLEEYFSRIVP